MKIRQAKAQDADQLVTLSALVQQVHTDLFPAFFRNAENETLAQIIRQNLIDESLIILVAEEDDALLGYLVLKKQIRPEFALCREQKCGYIDQICVSEEHRGKGIFKRLLKEAGRIATEWGFDRIELNVWSENKRAREAFLKSGFRTYSEKMSLDLKSLKE